jgi:predicted polyphosphate/ATP-dependent NAD kinase
MPGPVATPRRIGLVVNPIAGMGGRVGLKGTDGEAALALALRRGASPAAPIRARRALARLASCAALPPRVLAAPGAMGAQLASEAGLEVSPTGPERAGPTAAADTRAAAAEMLRQGVELVLFAGGDGTARDVHDAIGTRLPLVGVPAGVKMHSGVFASSPEAAGAATAAYLNDPGAVPLHAADVADVDEDALRAGRVTTRLHGSALVPREPTLLLGAKAAARPASADAALDALCAEIAGALPAGRLHLLGPGTTTARILAPLGLGGTLLGVDAVRDGALVGEDLDERGLLALLDAHGQDVQLLLGVVGGQGALLGRGNQQLSPRVLRRVGRERIRVVAAADKLLALDPPTLRVDTGDPDLDRALAGHVRVDVAPGRTIVMKVST